MALTADTEKIMSVATGPEGMVVERHGAGPPVLLVHGLGGPMMWEKLVPILARSREVIIPHLQGFGESAASQRTMSSDDHARLLGDFLMRSGLSGVTLAGISYGGAVAAHLAAGRRLSVGRLVLICPTGLREYPGAIRFEKIIRHMTRRALRWTLSNRWAADRISRRAFQNPRSRPFDLLDRYISQMRVPGHREAVETALWDIARQGRFLPGLASGFPGDTTIVWGDHDRILPPENATRLDQEGRSFKIVRFSGCGHSVPLENPDGLSHVIADSVISPPQAAGC